MHFHYLIFILFLLLLHDIDIYASIYVAIVPLIKPKKKTTQFSVRNICVLYIYIAI